MPGHLDGQVAIVTGAGRGFGRAIAERFAAQGAAVTLTARTQSELDRAVAEITATGGKAIGVAGDVTDRADVAGVVRATEEAFGPAGILISNAGLAGPYGPTWAIDPDEWWASQAVHIKAPVLFMNAAIPAMIARGGGRIVLVSAIASHLTAPYLSAYCVGKTAQVRLAQHVALEAKDHGVQIFAIDPGFVITDLAESTMGSPDAQRWLPGMVERLRERKAAGAPPDDLGRCAQRCLDLVSGRYDGLSGRYMELGDDLDAMLGATA